MLKLTEKGFTLVEILVALAIFATIASVMSAAVFLLIKTASQNDELLVNLRQVQNAGYWISRDAIMAQEVHTSEPGVFLSLSWCDWEGNSFNVDYVLQDDELIRQFNGGSGSLIAQYIIPDPATKCEWHEEEKRLSVTITAALYGNKGGHIERTYEIYPRSVAEGD